MLPERQKCDLRWLESRNRLWHLGETQIDNARRCPEGERATFPDSHACDIPDRREGGTRGVRLVSK